MNKIIKSALVTIAVVFSSATMVVADIDDGLRAAQAGDFQTALKEWRPLADQGDASAQNYLGHMYNFGWGVEQDYTEAMKWYRLAADQGYARAQTNLWGMYYLGRGVEQDYAEAMKWYRFAADQGYARAQTHLGEMYYLGWGVEQDYAEAMKWYRLAAEQDHAPAQTDLGSMYRFGQGVEQDYAEALKWYRLAAEQDHAPAQTDLGSMYRFGQGVEQDYAEALKWYRLAADQGYAAAQGQFAWLLYLSGKYEEALKMADLSLKNRPEHSETIGMRALVLAAMGRTEEAQSEIERAIKIGGNETIRLYQEALLKRGYDIGAADGIYGRKTREALIDCLKAGCRLVE